MKHFGLRVNRLIITGLTLLFSGILSAGVTVPTPEVRQSPWQCKAPVSGDWLCQRHSRGAFEFSLEQVTRSAPPQNSRNPMHWPKDSYTIQLIAVSDQKNIQQLRRQDPRLQRATEVVIENNQKPLYLLLLGHYPTKAAAQDALKRFAIDEKTKVTPWIRPLDNLQKRAPKLVAGQS